MQDLLSRLKQISEEFLSLDEPMRLELLLEYSESLPELPEKYKNHLALLEPVLECQSPVFLIVEIDGDILHPIISAPKEAPTTRGFASILIKLIDGIKAKEINNIPDDFAYSLGITKTITPLRLRGMSGMLHRIKAQTKRKLELGI